jgi:hypothetical protein
LQSKKKSVSNPVFQFPKIRVLKTVFKKSQSESKHLQ